MARTATRALAVPLSQEEDVSAQARALHSTRALSLSPRILELLTLPCSLEELEEDYRVTSISDDLRIGFAISDHATQTDTNEIRELKEFTASTRMLLNFANSIYDDFAMYKTILKAQYEEKIQEHAFRLWQDINDRLQYVEDFYKQKEAKMRHSFQQQLCDALAILRTNYTKYFQIEEGKTGKDEETLGEKLDRLRTKIEEQAALITSLEEDLLNYKMKETKRDKDIEKELLQQENWEFKQQLTSLNEKMTRLQENVKRKEKDQVELETEIRNMQDKRERDMKTIEKLMNTQEILKLELDREKQRVLSKALEVKEAQDAVQKLKEASASPVQKLPSSEGIKQAKKGKGGKKAGKGETKQQREAREAAEKEAAAKEAAAKEAAAREAAAKEKYLGSSQDLETEILMLQNEIKRLKKSEEKARLQARRLEHEIRHSSQAWEMKFEILKRSLHAIKDEMFLRQSLRQSSKSRRPLHTDRPGINPQTDAEAKDEGTAKIPLTIDIPGTYEGGSDYEEDFEEAPHVPSPTTPLL
ncbi:uncharacterized protein C10orf67 homolog, mitochondrial [Tiliqua scincoides]|uniref:uncharacterized protein C10orf67 homolog, mitochondrial n=1 Tax=Tiliqua scincoides TaxID=71010 RepID=UPI00346344F7